MQSPKPSLDSIRIVWLDTETTGLDPDTEGVLQVGTIITDRHLSEIARDEWLVLPDDLDGLISRMNEKAREMHTRNGLLDRCRVYGIPVRHAQFRLTSLVRQHCPNPSVTYLAGNTIHFDRRFIHRHMPEFLAHVSHRMIDVSTLKVLASMWQPEAAAPYLGREADHTTIKDLEHSQRELRHWLALMFRPECIPLLPELSGP
jgi:oligoribonuclease